VSEQNTRPTDTPGLQWRDSRTRVFLDSHTPDWEDPHQRSAGAPRSNLTFAMDPDAAMKTIADSGADSVILFAKCQYGNSYYPTGVGHQHTALAGRDLFGEQVAAATRHGMKVMAYFSNMWDVHEAGAHPDWLQVGLEGRPRGGRWPSLCLLSGYRDLALAHVREIAERYEIDGLWSDILTAGPCACARCAAAFEADHGYTMPQHAGVPEWADVVRFSGKVIDQYLADQRAALDEVRPAVALVPNFYGTTAVNAVSGLHMGHLERADIGSGEGYTDWHGLAFPSFAARYVRRGVDERPAEILTGRFVHTWDFTLVSTAQMRYEAFTAVANGATVTVDDQPYADGSLEPEVYRRLGEVFGEINRRSPYLEGVSPERYAALYASQKVRTVESVLQSAENPSVGELTAQFPPSQRRDGVSDLEAAVTGTYRALLESHVPVDFLDDRQSSLAWIGKYRVLVLADVLTLDTAEVQALCKYVDGGGALVVTGPIDCVDEDGSPKKMSRELENLLGVRYGTLSRFTYPYLAIRDAQLATRVGTWPIPHYGAIANLEVLAEGVDVLATRTDPILETADGTFWHNNLPAPGAVTDTPVIVERRFGKGRVIVSAARLGNNHARLGHGAYRDLVSGLVARAAGEAPAVTVRGGHRNMELVSTVRGEDLIVHLVTGNPVRGLEVFGVRQPGVIEDIAHTGRIDLVVPVTTRAVRRVRRQSTLELPVDEGSVVSVLDASDWETLVLEGAARST